MYKRAGIMARRAMERKINEDKVLDILDMLEHEIKRGKHIIRDYPQLFEKAIEIWYRPNIAG